MEVIFPVGPIQVGPRLVPRLYLGRATHDLVCFAIKTGDAVNFEPRHIAGIVKAGPSEPEPSTPPPPPPPTGRNVWSVAAQARAETVAELLAADPTWRRFSCAAELLIDAARFLRCMMEDIIPDDRSEGFVLVRMGREDAQPLYDPWVGMEFVTTLSLDRLRAILRDLDEDTHVMRQTLRPCALAENSLERDWEV